MKTREAAHQSLDDSEASVHEPWIAPEEPAGTRSVLAAVDSLPEAPARGGAVILWRRSAITEVAALTGRPVNTIKSDLLRARGRLREMLEDGPGRGGAKGDEVDTQERELREDRHRPQCASRALRRACSPGVDA